MSYTPEHKERTRNRILDAAAVLVRQKGLENTGVAEVMGKAGLTAGGFYAHFESKEDLLAHAILRAFELQDERFYQKLTTLDDRAWVDAVIHAYLNPWHRDHPGEGCPLAALVSDYSRAGRSVRALMGKTYQHWTSMLSDRLGSEDEAIAITSYLVGTLALSRSVGDRELSNKILDTGRRMARKLLNPASKKMEG